MYLKKLHITNFRCFKDYEVEFAPRVTVLFGKNGAGKSTLIHAIHKAMSFMMYSYNVTENVKIKGKSKKKVVDVKTIANNNPYLHPKSFAKDDFNNSEDKFIEVAANANFGESLNDVDWKISVIAKNCRLRPSEFEDAFLSFYEWHSNTNELPLLAYFSDSFPHREDKKKKTIKAKIASLRNFGYFDWDEEEGCTKEWIERFERTMRNRDRLERRFRMMNDAVHDFGIEKESVDKTMLLERQMLEMYKNEISAIEACLVNFSKHLGIENSIYNLISLGLHLDDDKLCIITNSNNENDRYKSFRKLPAGYKRLLNIVLDLAYRSYILSGGKSCDIKGLAIIDEIDLHLHPELEKVVLGGFMDTFPNLQFIVSTHSPLVLTGLETEGKPNKILRMEPNTNAPVLWPDVYGIDYNSGLEDIMGVESKNANLDHLISLCAYMRKRGKTAQADNIKQRIVNQFAKNSDELEKLIEKKEKEL
jgi:predicted ATP-binding protein involved in virulence